VKLHGSRRLRFAKLLSTCLAVTVASGTIASQTFAATGLRYQVVDADNARDGGVYYRNSPRWGDTARIVGLGGYYGETVELVCYEWGEAVGPFANRVWHYVNNLSRPVGYGWLPDRYLNTPVVANQLVPGEPQCGASPPPPVSPPTPTTPAPPTPPTPPIQPTSPPPTEALLPGGGSAYYSPNNGTRPIGSPATWTLAYEASTRYSVWKSSSRCGTDRAWVPETASGKRITTLAGWSKGRLGPIYFLRANRGRWATINYILMLDPGSRSNFKNPCDRRYDSGLLAGWLRSNRANRLVILAGKTTADYRNRDNGYGHAGIQNAWFPRIRGHAIARQVVVCNYDRMGHEDVFKKFAGKMNDAPITRSTCPSARGYGRADHSWSP
jgi:hypothetical protein